ncbi:thioesterase family protein [Leptospira ellisii]|uniref:Thioesterase n=1 Tax=Leptospira ellisii TaxID=2023197 RepID=A0A2N0BED1_9LEPT|nr:thioesterase family protein [Leptospira ellisii]MDV6236300.1 thioesterase family protein [Leptospira ellisii]PJZ94906.1 thioesterase [Leptospira ellisii]
MARIQLELPQKFVWSVDLDVRIYDVNFADHLAHDRVISLLHEARARFFLEHNYSELNVDGLGIIMTDIAVVYKAEAFFRDKIRVEITAGDFNSRGCDVYYRMSHADGPANGKTICEAKTGIVFMDYKTRTLGNLPEGFRKIFP